ncbi:hypothetical protein NUV89_07480 [Pseudomonas sp. 18.1.10]|uniref:dermonecrotic toxin domain-containing protein n=1 Tax=Pseudomonas sp. 18.1.10 TaxID=2969302 RepID=UPI00214F645B|nr:DUF6543 domain-containing protein [Pseudomonas sp. 18.1.10]MCR4538231.1 hypothetical protein [Pseudomonas sp. 18.1.10]
MASVTPPYFFDEYHRPITRKQPTKRERALGLTLEDLNWLGTVYSASHAGRSDRTEPMVVEKLAINRSGEPDIPLAGAFIMSPTPSDKKAVLYTPYAGLEVFLDRADCLSQVTERLKSATLKTDLIRFFSIKQRAEFNHDSPFTLTATTIPGGVFKDQEATLEANQAHNVQRMLEELRTIPTLAEFMEGVFDVFEFTDFPHLDHRDTRVNSFIPSTHHNGDGVLRWVESATLEQTVLQYYVKQDWPANRTRTFTNPKHEKSTFTKAQHQKDTQRWERLVPQAAGILSKLLNALLQTWWHEPLGKDKSPSGQSRTDLFTQVMSDKFRQDLLLKRQSREAIVSSQEARNLLAVFLPSQAERSAWQDSLRIEKVSIAAPYQHYVELAATLLISDQHAYLYTQSGGLQVLKDVDDLNKTLLSMLDAAHYQDELLNYLSLDERSLYLAMKNVHIRGLPLEGSVFGEMVSDIQAKQLSNLQHALAIYRRSDGAVDLAALLDCSLDIRHMLDSRLLKLDAAGRWSLHPVNGGNGRPSTVQAERAKLQLAALQPEEDRMLKQRAEHPTLRSKARKALNNEIKAQFLYQDANDIYVNTYASEARDIEDRTPQSSLSMVEYFIKHLADTDEDIGKKPHIGCYHAPQRRVSVRWHNLDNRLFNAIIRKVRPAFLEYDVRTLPRLFLDSHAADMTKALMQGLRSEAELRLLNHTLSPNHFAILDTVLRPDSMTRDKRHGYQGFLPDAFALTLTRNADPLLRPLANSFVLTERGGLDPDLSGAVVLWTPQLGYEPFASLTALRESLKQRLNHPTRRLALLQNLPISLWAPHQTYQLGPLQRIDGHFLENRLQSNLTRDLDAIDHWVSMSLEPTQLQDRLDDVLLRMAPSNIGRATAIANAIVQQHGLPVWLGLASTEEQLRHAELLEQYRLSAPDNQDYLHGVPTLREHVASTLTALLKARYPDDALDPENILIPARVVLNGHPQSLTDFAMLHLPDLLPDNLTPKARGTRPLPKTLDGSAVVQLVRQLDISKTFSALLTTHLTADTDDARRRRDLFCQQLPWQVLRHAHEEKLEERLSSSAWGFIQQIFDMPDAVARDAVSGATAMIRPLELVITAGATPAKVPGVYVIGPKDGETGPSVLYAPYAPLNALKEYGTAQKLLEDIGSDGPVQDWVISQMSDPDQAKFRNLFKERVNPPHKPENEVSLASNPIRGNLLRQLFHDNAEQLIKMLACQFEKAGKHQWEGITSLFREGIPMALQFIAGKLRYPLVVWRSYKLFKASAEQLQEQHFGEGLRRFVQGVATLASLRKQLDESLSPEPMPDTPAAPESPAPATTAETLDVTEPTRTHLRRFEDVAVALTDLQLDPRTHVYTQPVNNRTYVPVAGRVYPVARSGEHWRVSLARELGPFVERNAQGQWVLDLSRREPRFGPALSRLGGYVSTRRTLSASINIEAVGLPAIRGQDWDKGLQIDRALNIALYYTIACGRNLTAFARQRDTDSRVGRILTEMFGILTFNPAQVEKIRARVREIENGLSAEDLLRLDSGRFVSGEARRGTRNSLAFVIPDDLQRKIYLLNLFFKPGMNRLYAGILNGPFDIEDHVRAATLIHEMSHLVAHTEDIAYVDAPHPFLDLVSRGTADGLEKYTTLSNIQSTALSVLTPATMLFKTYDSLSKRWEDFGETGSVRVRDKVLHLTGARTLDEARQTFMSDPDRRLDIILANADSVTYLITHVGRQRD